MGIPRVFYHLVGFIPTVYRYTRTTVYIVPLWGAQMLEVSLLGVGTVLRLERDA